MTAIIRIGNFKLKVCTGCSLQTEKMKIYQYKWNTLEYLNEITSNVSTEKIFFALEISCLFEKKN